MNILVLSDNLPLLQMAKPIFLKRTTAKFLFTDSDAIDPQMDYVHIATYFDMVISLHCKKIFPKELYNNVKCINVHPGYNPYNRGMYPHVFSIINGHPAGATIHEIDSGPIDSGPIIAQVIVDVLLCDTSTTLYERIIDAELELLDQNLDALISGKYYKFVTGYKGNYNSLDDYKKLCDTPMPDIVYNTLRALSHEKHWNTHRNGIYYRLEIKK